MHLRKCITKAIIDRSECTNAQASLACNRKILMTRPININSHLFFFDVVGLYRCKSTSLMLNEFSYF